jgi:hypothetical protein
LSSNITHQVSPCGCEGTFVHAVAEETTRQRNALTDCTTNNANANANGFIFVLLCAVTRCYFLWLLFCCAAGADSMTV